MILKYSNEYVSYSSIQRNSYDAFPAIEAIYYEQFNFAPHIQYPKWIRIGNDLYMAVYNEGKEYRRELVDYFLRNPKQSIYRPMRYINDPQIL